MTEEAQPQSKVASRPPPWAAIIAILAIFFIIGLVPKMVSFAELRMAVRHEKSAATEVTVVHPRAAAESELLLPSDVQSIAQTTISARNSGYLKKRLSDIGDRVHKGQVLAEIWSPETNQDLAAARAQLMKSRAGTGQAQADLVSKQAALMQARAGVSHATAAVAQNRANYNQAVAALRRSEHNLVAARSQSKLAHVTYQRNVDLARQGFVTSQDLDTARTQDEAAGAALKAAEADVEAARAATEAAQQNLLAAQADLQSARQNVEAASAIVRSGQMNVEAQIADNQANQANVEKNQALSDYQRVVAPFDGVITARYVDVGALIKADPASSSTQTALFGMARTDVMRVLVSVPQAYVTLLRGGEAVDVQVREYPDHPFAARVARLAGGLDASTRTQQVEIHIPNQKQMLLPGMYAEVRFHQKASQSLVRLVSSAFIIDAQGTRVAVVRPDHHVHLLSVAIGRDFGEDMEVRGRLTPQDSVVDNPPEELAEGQLVHVQEASK